LTFPVFPAYNNSLALKASLPGGTLKMYINVAQLLKEPVGSTRSYKVDEFIGKEGTNHVQGQVTLIHTNCSVLVQGSMTASVRDICNRCLQPVDFSVTFNMEDEYFPSVDITSGLPMPTNPDRFTLDQNHVLDLSEALDQYMLAAMPMKVLCRPDCAGICPSCGHNLNEGSCSCPSSIKDPRWSKLVNLKKGE
jgi:uncharacterized protein